MTGAGPGTCSPEDVLLDVADRLSRPAASMSAARTRLAVLARRLPLAADDPGADLAAIARLLHEHLPRGAPLLLPDALRAGRAHPLAAAAAAVCAARRAGLPVDVVGHDDRIWLAHHRPGCTLLVDPGAPGEPFDGRALGVDLHWRCAHELAALTLRAVAARAERAGDLDLALRVLRARRSLPVEDGRLAGLQSRLN